VLRVRSLKILVISERYWPDGSGGELATHLIVGILSKKFDVTVVTGSKNPSRLPNVEYIYEPLLSKWEKPLLWLNSLRLAGREEFKKLLREADVVYIPRFAFPVIPYAKKMGKRVIVHLHDYIPVSYTAVILAPYEKHRDRITRDDITLECRKGLKYCSATTLLWWLPRLARKWISQADKVICVSHRQAEIISDQAPELRDKIEVVYNPLPQELREKEPRKELDDTPTLLYSGGDSYVKGFHVLLQTLNKLCGQGFKVRFFLTNKYGSSSLEALRRLKDKCISVEVQVLGRLEYSELHDLHRQAWALITPSIWEETFLYAAIEASVLKTIPITSRVGGIAELLSDTIASKFMFAPGSSSELSEKLQYVCSLSESEIDDIGYKLRNEILRKLDQSRIEEEILSVFSSVLENRDL